MHFMTTENDEPAVEGFEFELEAYDDNDSSEALAQLVDDMGEPCKTILISYYFKALSLKLIAEAMDYKSDQVARQQKYRCIQQLRLKAEELKIYGN